jgi:hypothetical protein
MVSSATLMARYVVPQITQTAIQASQARVTVERSAACVITTPAV